MTRASVIDVLNEDYVRTARSKGLARGLITRRHVLRNAMLPVTTTIGLQTGALLAGAVLLLMRRKLAEKLLLVSLIAVAVRFGGVLMGLGGLLALGGRLWRGRRRREEEK